MLWSMFGYTVFSLPAQQRLGHALLMPPIALLALVLWHYFRQPVWHQRLKLPVVLTTAYLVLSVVTSYLNNPHLSAANQVFLWFASLQILLFAILLPEYLGGDDYESVLRVLAIFFGLVSVLCLALAYLNQGEVAGIALQNIGYRSADFTRYSIFINRNYEAAFIQWAPPIALWLALRQHNKRSQIFYVAICAICTLHILLTFSRAAQLATFIALSPVPIWVYRRSKTLFVAMAVAVAAGLAVFVGFSDFAFYKYVETPLAMRDRDQYWLEIMQYLSENGRWLFGSGYLGYWPLGNRPHNGYLCQWLYFGIFAPILLSAISWRIFRIAVPTWSATQNFQREDWLLVTSLLGALAAELVTDNIANPLFPTAIFYWFMLGGLRHFLLR